MLYDYVCTQVQTIIEWIYLKYCIAPCYQSFAASNKNKPGTDTCSTARKGRNSSYAISDTEQKNISIVANSITVNQFQTVEYVKIICTISLHYIYFVRETINLSTIHCVCMCSVFAVISISLWCVIGMHVKIPWTLFPADPPFTFGSHRQFQLRGAATYNQLSILYTKGRFLR